MRIFIIYPKSCKSSLQLSPKTKIISIAKQSIVLCLKILIEINVLLIAWVKFCQDIEIFYYLSTFEFFY